MPSHWLFTLLALVSLCLSLDTELDHSLDLVWTRGTIEFGNETGITPLLTTTLSFNAQPQLTDSEFHENVLVQKLFGTYDRYESRAHATPMRLPLVPECTESSILSQTVGYLKGLLSGPPSSPGIGPTIWALGVVDDQVTYEIGVRSWFCRGDCAATTPTVFAGSKWIASAFKLMEELHESLPIEFAVQITDDEGEWRASVRVSMVTEGMGPSRLNSDLWRIPTLEQLCT